MLERGYVQFILIGIVAVAVAGALWYVYEEGHDAGYAEAMVELREAEKAQEAQEAKASTALETDRERVRTVYRTITKEVDRVVERPVYRDVCLDADGLRIVNAALAGALKLAGEPDGGMPAAGADRGREGVDDTAGAGQHR